MTLPVFFDKQNNAVQFNDSTDALIVLRNRKSCQDCFHHLDKYLSEQPRSVALYSASISDSNTLERKRNCALSVQLMPGLKPLVFYRSNLEPFERYAEEWHTPFILIIKDGETEILNYSSLFNPGEAELQETTKAKLNSLLIR